MGMVCQMCTILQMYARCSQYSEKKATDDVGLMGPYNGLHIMLFCWFLRIRGAQITAVSF